MVFMDTLAIPTGAPNRDLAYKMIGQSISPEGQKQIADGSFNLSSFGVDRNGEIYALAHAESGGIFKLVP